MLFKSYKELEETISEKFNLANSMADSKKLESLKILSEIKESLDKSSDVIERFDEKQQFSVKIKRNLVRILEIYISVNINTLKIEEIDFFEFRELFRPIYDAKLTKFDLHYYREYTGAIYPVIFYIRGYLQLCRVMVDIQYSRFNDGIESLSRQAIQNKIRYLLKFFRRSGISMSGYRLTEEEIQVDKFDKEKAEMLEELIQKNDLSLEPLPKTLIVSYDEASKFSESIMKLCVEARNERIKDIESRSAAAIQTTDLYEEFLRLNFHRGMIYNLLALFTSKATTKQKLLRKALDCYIADKQDVIELNPPSLNIALRRVCINIDEIFKSLIIKKYDELEQYIEEEYIEHIEQLKKLVLERQTHAEFFIETVLNTPEHFNPKILIDLFNDLAKWTELVLEDQEKVQEYEERCEEYINELPDESADLKSRGDMDFTFGKFKN